MLALVAGMAAAQDAAPVRRFGPPWPDTPRQVPVNVPREFNLMVQSPEAGGVVSLVQYPQMRPFPASALCPGWCDGKLMVTVKTNDRSEVYSQAWDLRRGRERAASGGPSNVSYTPLPVPSGFTEAWEVTMVGPPISQNLLLDRRIYIRSDAAGVPLEHVVCGTRGADPPCVVSMTLDGEPALQINIAYSVRYWEQRDAIRAAVQHLVRSWM